MPLFFSCFLGFSAPLSRHQVLCFNFCFPPSKYVRFFPNSLPSIYVLTSVTLIPLSLPDSSLDIHHFKTPCNHSQIIICTPSDHMVERILVSPFAPRLSCHELGMGFWETIEKVLAGRFSTFFFPCFHGRRIRSVSLCLSWRDPTLSYVSMAGAA